MLFTKIQNIMETAFEKQRIVSKKLGKNITKDHTFLYDEIEKRIGATKKCRFGVRGGKTDIKHIGDENVPIRDFELKWARIDENGSVAIKSGDGLQGFCRSCSKMYRRARINRERETKQNKKQEEIYGIYEEKYQKKTKKCSRCEMEKSINEFNISISMECGLHNMCKVCSYEYGSSVGNRWILYMPDNGSYKYAKEQPDTHDDHIFPLSLGGSNALINHQLLNAKENIQKSNDILCFETIDKINPEMLSVRFRKALTEATGINELKTLLNRYVYQDILERSRLNDEELVAVYKQYCESNNLKRDAKRAVKKFREYCVIRGIKGS